jgi:threonine dehydratase
MVLTRPRLATVVSIPGIADLPTPLEEAPPELSEGRPLFLKREDVHELGAFKWRGALPALEKYRAGGAGAVVTASTGNHGTATAWAAERTGMRAVVFVPEAASKSKLALLEQLGAELHRVGSDLDEAKDLAREHAAANDLPFFEDGAEPAQFDGYEAIGVEILRQLGRAPETVIVPVGNGALIIGVRQGIGRVSGVVAKEAPVMALSVEAGHPVECDRSATFADGMAVRVAIPLAVEELRRGYPMMMVSEREIAHAVREYSAAGIRVEGAAAAPLAAYRKRRPRLEPIVLIVTGRNIDDELHRRCVEDPDSFPD